MRISDVNSDLCSSDLPVERVLARGVATIPVDPLFRLIEQKHDLVRLEPRYAREVPVRENGAARKLGGWRMIGCWHQSGRVARATRPRKRRRRKPSASLPVQLLASTAASSAGVSIGNE